MSVYQLSYSEVLRADEAFKLDLLRVLIKVDVDLVLVVKPVVEEHRLNVVLLRKVIVKLSQSVLFAHQEQTLAIKSLLCSNLLLSDCFRLLCSVCI